MLSLGTAFLNDGRRIIVQPTVIILFACTPMPLVFDVFGLN